MLRYRLVFDPVISPLIEVVEDRPVTLFIELDAALEVEQPPRHILLYDIRHSSYLYWGEI